MDIQSTLTQAIEFIVMSFVALMIFDFIDGLYVVPLPFIAIAQSNASSNWEQCDFVRSGFNSQLNGLILNKNQFFVAIAA
ncbi:hypothetical protein LC612_30285 [Nostoc sp. CHAB 5834]|nr:hypothetical protein [Nostoc sp. CHAB 5834]